MPRVDTENQRHLLVVVGAGGPGPRRLASSVTGLARVTWLHETGADELLNTAVGIHCVDPFDGLLALSDSTQRVAAAIGEKLALPFNSPAAAELLTDRCLQRAALADAGLPTPRYSRVGSVDELDAAARQVGFPAVLKAIRGNRGVLSTPVLSSDELRSAWLSLPLSTRAGMMLEQLLVGQRWHDVDGYGHRVCVDSLLTGGTIVQLALADTLRRPSGLPRPSVLPGHLRVEILAMAEAGVRALEVTEGLVHTRLKLTAAGPRIIDLSAGPTRPLTADYDMVAAAARSALRLAALDVPDLGATNLLPGT